MWLFFWGTRRDQINFLCNFLQKNCSLSTTYNGEMTHRKRQKWWVVILLTLTVAKCCWSNITVHYFLAVFDVSFRRGDPLTDFDAQWLKMREITQGCAFWGLEYLILTFDPYLPQNVKFWPHSNFKPKCWKIKVQVYKKLLNQQTWKFSKMLRMYNSVPYAIWWRHTKSNMAVGRHI